MKEIFTDGAPFAKPLRRILGRLCARDLSHLILAVADDVVRQEAMMELSERLSGSYSFVEFNFADTQELSLLRYYRQISGGREGPVCVFANGLEVLKVRDAEAYGEALHFLNAHREDLDVVPGAVVLWLTLETWRDVLGQAPDFADWESVGVTFTLTEEERVERMALEHLSTEDAEALRRQVRHLEEMLARPNLGAALETEFHKQLSRAERLLGTIA